MAMSVSISPCTLQEEQNVFVVVISNAHRVDAARPSQKYTVKRGMGTLNECCRGVLFEHTILCAPLSVERLHLVLVNVIAIMCFIIVYLFR